MRLCKLSAACLCLLSFAVCALAQITPAPERLSTTNTCGELNAGIVVEDAGNSSGIEGLQKGDIILNWVRSKAGGDVESPFDLYQIAIDQASQGPVTLHGLRGKEAESWKLGARVSDVKTRPNFQDNLLSIYAEGEELAKAGKLSEAASRWRAASVAAQTCASAWLSSWFLFRAADLLAGAQRWDDADPYFRDAIEQAGAAEPPFKAHLFQEWAKTFYYRSRWADAEKYHLQALTEHQKQGPETMSVAMSLESLGIIAWRQDDLDRAEDYYRQALDIAEKLAPGTIYVASSLGNMGNLSFERGDLARAEEQYRKALAIEEKLFPNSRNLAAGFNELALVAKARGDMAKAEKYNLQALKIMEKAAPTGTPNRLDIASILTELGDCVLEQGDAVKAEEYYQQGLAIRKEVEPDGLGVAMSLGSLGELAQHRGDTAKAEQYYREALAIKLKVAPASIYVAITLKELGDAVQSRGDLVEAEQLYRQSLAIRERLVPGSKEHAEVLAALAVLMKRKAQPDAAAQLYQQALNAVESQTARLGGADDDRSRFRAKYVQYYKDYSDLLIAEKQPEAAFQVLERSRARTLLETLAAAHVNIRQGVDASLLEQERRLREAMTANYGRRIRVLSSEHKEEQVAGLDQEAKKLLAQYDDVEGQIRVSSPAYAALTQPQPLSTKDIQQELLDGNTLLLEYSLGEERSYVFVVSASSLAVYQIPKGATIEQAAQRVYDLLNKDLLSAPNGRNKTPADDGAEYSKAAARLSRMVLGPVASQLGRKRLLIVSDGALHYIPFAALPSPGKSPMPLMVRHEIINLPCASVLSALRRERLGRKMAPRMVAVLADPVFDNHDVRVKNAASNDQGNATTRGVEEDAEEQSLAADSDSLTRSVADMGAATKRTVYLPRLQLTRQEARSILAVTPAGQAMAALDFKASRAAALSPSLAQYRIVHFATHGLVNSKHPELSGLVLSLVDEQGRPQNGFLGLQDIYNLNLPAELVVLSACETGLGKNIQGEGLIGLTRGFMYAGASRVVASLWKIDDQGTAMFMGEFYRAMEQQGMRPAAALRAAQIHMWQQKRWSSPYYWAAFQIHGEWK